MSYMLHVLFHIEQGCCMFFGLFKLQPHCDPVLAAIGFFIHLTSYLLVGVYLLWALIPDHILLSIGVVYYPQKYWALLLPVYPCILILAVYVTIALTTYTKASPLDSDNLYKDSKTNISEVPSDQGIPAVRDLNILDIMTETYEVFSISGHYVLHNEHRSLWCSKLDGGLTPSNSSALDASLEPVCLGVCYGIVGRIQFLPDSPVNLVLISDRQFVCKLHQHEVYRINDITILPLSLETPHLNLHTCKNHPPPPKGAKVAETDTKIERKLEEEFVKWFEKSFYYSTTGDITHNLTELQQSTSYSDTAIPLWNRVKERYFWNLSMLDTLISSYSQFPEVCDPWIIPVMQGYIESKEVEVSLVGGLLASTLSFNSSPSLEEKTLTVTLTVVSRRSKYRAGTRFKRRGIDVEGNPANYVETEQLLEYNGHVTSYTIVRGSVPVYWYQPLTNYRPKPVLLQSPEESLKAFKIHMDNLISQHGKVVIVNLLDSQGKEAPLGDEYAKVAYMYDNEKLTYVAFDFNEYCGGMKFDNVSALLKELDGITDNYGFTHTCNGESLQLQKGAVRVNCMDSLDRTNVVQGSIARTSLRNQALLMGVPFAELLTAANILWANNGDAISTQYAGTAALKGDYTRTGERGVAGMMRDGVSSVTRMYINVFRDTNRQAAIDIMMQIEPELLDIRSGENEELDCIPSLLEEGKRCMPSADESKSLHKSWICQDYSTGRACGVWLSANFLDVVTIDPDSKLSLAISTCDKLQIGQPANSLGHYLRIVSGKTVLTIRPLTADVTQLQDCLVRMAHAIVSCRDDLGIPTQVQHGQLSKPNDLMDMGLDKIKSSANSIGTKLAASAKRMIGEAKGVLDSRGSSNTSPSPNIGRKVFNLFKRDEKEVSKPQPTPVTLSEVRKSSFSSGSSPELEEMDGSEPTIRVRSALSESDLLRLVEGVGQRESRSQTFHVSLRDTRSKSNFVFISLDRTDIDSEFHMTPRDG